MTTDTQPSPPFTHEKNITVGSARVIWVKAYGYKPEGWILPGGHMTRDYHEALACAVRINKLMGGE